MTTDRTTEEQHMTEQQTPTPPSGSNTAASAGVGGTCGRGGADGGGEDASGAAAIVEQARLVAEDLLDRRDALDTSVGNRDYKFGQRMGYEDAARFLRTVLDGGKAWTLTGAAEERARYAPGHFDGDGCTFPTSGHFATGATQ